MQTKYELTANSQVFFYCDLWPVTCDLWPVTCDLWPVTCDLWPVTCDLQPVTCDLYFSTAVCSISWINNFF